MSAAARLLLRQPLQERSRRTLERFLDATERLLEERRFEEISVEEIVRGGRASIGAFYARFRDKQALLPSLYARYDERLGARLAALERSRPAAQSLEQTAEWIAREFLRLFRQRTNLMRALALYARTHEAEIGAEVRARRQAQQALFLNALLAHRERITHPDPERAVELALYFAVSALRDRVLFAASTHAAATRLGDAELVRECVRMLVGYLTLSSPMKVLLFLSFALSPFARAAAQETLPIAGEREERTIEADGVVYEIDVGRVRVAENRDAKSGRAIELAVGRLHSTAEEPGAPIVFLAGGPGDGATSLVDNSMWAAYLELGDVLLIDQRGTGRSQPSLAWSSPALDPSRLFGEREGALAAVLEWAGLAAAELRGQGVDLAAYTTRASADDIADVLTALGYERARLLAHSYGTHLALEVLRRHEKRIERVALLGVAGSDDLLKPAGELEPFVRELARRAAKDPAVSAELPDLAAALDKALERAAKEPFVVQLQNAETEAPIELRIGRFGLQQILLADLGDPSDLPVFPRLLHQLGRGETELLAWFAAKRYQRAQTLPLAFYALRGSSGVSKERQARLASDAKTSRFGDTRNFPFPEILAPLGIRDLGHDFRKPVTSDVPALLVSGTLDANTPPYQAEAVKKTLAHAAHLVVENAGHDDLLFDESIRERIVAFLAGDEPSDAPLALEPRAFAPVAGPVKGDAHPALAPR